MKKLQHIFFTLILLATLGVGQMWGAATQRYIYCGISNNYDTYKDGSNWGFNFWGGTSEGVKTPTYIADYTQGGRNYKMYRVEVYDNNNKAQFKGNGSWWIPDGGFSVTLNGTTNNAVFFSANEDGWYGQFQENYQVTSTASLSASSTSITTAQTSTLTPSLSSNATYNTIKSTTYSVTTNPGSAGSVTSGGVFSATAGGTYTVTATVTYNAKDFTGITKTATATKTITVTGPSISLSAPSSGVRGNSITLTASTSNASTPTIYYEYSTSSTFASSVTEINHTTSTSQSWTIPSGTSGTTYYLRAKMQVSSVWYYSSILTLTAYGKKTIHVKNTNNWTNVYLYTFSSETNGSFPGKTGASYGAENTGGQWWDITITTQSTKFILSSGNSSGGPQTADLTSSNYTDGSCYAIATGTGTSIALSNTTVTCPSAPTSVTTTATPTSITNTQMTIGGNIGGNGNDNITDYGFYWGTTSACGTKAQVGTSNKTGAISKQLTGLTAGTTYYFKTYATNGQGTTYGTVRSYKIPYSVTITKSTGCSSITPSAGSYYYNAGFTVTAVAATGYNFSTWTKTNGDLSSAASPSTGTNTVTFTPTANSATITATYTPKTTTITYSQSGTGYASGGPSTTKTATYASAMPSISGSVPVAANGYAFMGYYDGENGTGTQYYTSTGASARTWNKTSSSCTLYAYFKKAEITGLTFDAVAYEPGGTVGVTPVISPTPTGSTVVCWRVLHNNDNPLDDQPSFSANPSVTGAKVTFPASTTSGTYKVEATLHLGSTCDGTELSTYAAPFQVAGDHTVTVEYKCGSETIKNSTTVTGRPLTWSSVINPPEIFGYTFSRWVAVDGVTLSTNGTSELGSDNTTTPAIYIKAIYDGKLKAEYTQNQYIYFKNTLGWSNVYVNFYTGSYWNNPKGSGNSGVTNKNLAMTRIGETDVWYYDYGGASITPTLYVSFTSESQNGSENFWHKSPDVNVVYPANYPDDIHTDKSAENGFKAATPMFVPLASQAAVPLNSSGGGKANYYNAGYWTKYTPGTGYTLEIYYNYDESPTVKSIEFTSDDELMPMKAIASLEANTTYRYQLRRGGTGDDGIYYGNTGTMTYSNHEAWDMNNSMYPFQKAKITTNAAGDYTFKLNYAGHSSATTSYRLRMSVDYPIASGDYRVIYYDNIKPYWKPSAIVPKVENGKDTVSFFIRPGSTPYMKIQRSSVNESTGAITWSDYYSVPTATLTALPKDSVYNVCISMGAGGGASVEKIEAYTGNYYIRTDPANSKWDNYRSDPDHLMTYSEYSITHGGYSHYFCHWVQTDDRKNIKFCIANDYSPSISDTLIRETASGTWEHIADFIDADGNILRNANVRFMWDQHTNTISRAYIDGAYISGGDDFLVLVSGDSKILNPSTSAVQATTTFFDNQNWIYEANVKAIPNAQIKLRSIWGKDGETTHKITQYFKGGESSTETLITGSGSDPYDIRLLYDFKTNRLVAAMLPSGNYDDPEAIHADVMFIRDHQGDVSQLTFTDDGKITDINTAYAVIQLNKWTLNNKERTGSHAPLGAPASIYERSMYFISFPFQVNLSEVFGFGTYGEHWAIEYYDGEERAAKGYWMGDPGFWKFYWDRRNVVLEPNKGYILAIDLDLLGEESDVWANGNERAELFFPSAGSLGSITNSTVTKSLHEHACTINRAATEGLPDTPDNPHTSYNRTIFDSHWNVMGVPTYVNTAAQSWANTSWITATVDHKTQGPNFLYTWNMDDNTLTPTSGASFKYHAMHSYMVQYYGNVTWKTAQGPAAIVARRAYAAAPKNVEFCIEISDSEKMLDRTFLRLSEEEEVSANFAFNEDMTKDMNGRKANIYTLTADNVAAAGNTMPLNDQTLIVPLNVVTWTADNFTISIPEGTSGIGVTLVDEETGERTNLALGDYSRYLEKGTYSNRFHLEIAPIKQVPTGLEPTSDSSLEGRAQKRLIDGKLYILRDGKVYDARGNKVE